MPILSPRGPAVPPSLAAGLVLLSLELLAGHDLPLPTATSVVCALDASRSRAYAAKARLAEELPALARGPGRPAEASTPPPDTSAITAQVLDFVMRHPGCVALELTERHREVELAVLAQAIQVPAGTLRDWQRGGREAIDLHEKTNLAEVNDPVTEPRIAAVLAAWRTWSGRFPAFCEHVQLHLRIPFGRNTIARILEAEGVRIPKRRRGRSPDEDALRDSFRSFFAGDQWVGDGTPLTVVVDALPYTFNLELMVDPHSGAFVGASIREEEDGAAVVEAFKDGVATTGEGPLAVLLDNRPSNHTDEVVDALGDTIKVPATLGRAQNKAHVEGGFGLFQQQAPPLRLTSATPIGLAQGVLGLVVTTWARALNHKPRKDRDGKSRVQLYRESNPSDEDIETARAALQEQLRKQQKARQTREARLDPERRALLDDAFERLGLEDPERRLHGAIARYPIDAIVAGIAVFEGKARAGTLPDGVDARYLLGIVRRISDEEEGVAIAEALFDRRVELRDLALTRLELERDALEEEAADTLQWLADLVDRAVEANRFIDRHFWLRATADLIRDEDPADRRRLFLVAARRIHARHRLSKKLRNRATRKLAAMVLPVA